MNNKLLPLAIVLVGSVSSAQVGIGTIDPNNSAQLEITSSNKGVLIPRIALKNSTDGTTISNGNVESLLVFNTANENTLTAGYYYWYNNSWNRIINQNDLLQVDTNTKNTSFEIANGILLLNDTDGNHIEIPLSDLNIVTTFVNNNNATYSYTSENGTVTIIDVVKDVQYNFQEIVNYSSVVNILENIVRHTSGNIFYDGSNFTFNDNSGNNQVVNIKELIQNNQKTVSVSNGISTVVSSSTLENHTDFVIEVKDGAINTNKLANGAVTTDKLNTEGALPGQILIVNEDHSISYQNLPIEPIVGQNFTSSDLEITNGVGATLTKVTANIKDGVVTNQKLFAGQGIDGRIAIANASGAVTYNDLTTEIHNKQLTVGLLNGENTTVTSSADPVDANKTNWVVNVPTAKGQNNTTETSLGLVKEMPNNATVLISQEGELTVNNAVVNAVKEIETDYNASYSDVVLFANANNSSITITLPDPVDNKGKKFFIKKDDTNEDHYLNVTGVISGTTGMLYTALPHSGWEIVSDGTVWKIIKKF